MSINLENKICWVVTEGIAGTENQCIGVAEALGMRPVVKRIKLREPWKSFSPYLGLECWWSFDPLLFSPWPDILIAGGRKSIAVSRFIRRTTGGKTFTVQLQDPRIHPDNFDLVAVPEHDALRGSNVIVTRASPNRITEERLKREAYLWRDRFADLKKRPLIAVLIGGNSKTHKMDENGVQRIISTLKSLDAGLMITVSRRTPEKFRTMLRAALCEESIGGQTVYFWDGQGENPYFAMLGMADYIFVTNDSASMISEAATTGKPVYILKLKGESEKFQQFYKNMQKIGAIREFNGALEKWSYPPLQDSKIVAKAIEIALKRKFDTDKAVETL